VVSMPGVPFEMQGMMEASILPRLRQMNAGNLILHRTVLTHGMGESFLSRRLAHWEDTLPEGVSLAYLPSPGQVRLRLTIRGNDRERMRSMLDVAIRGLQVRIPRLIFGYGQDTMEGVTGQLLRTRQERVATAESCTGGYLAHLLTSVAGSSAYYQGSIIAYDNNVKVRLLGVDPLLLDRGGAVSEDVVRAMAEGARRRLGTDWAMATSGIAGPEGGTEEKPVGTTWISVAGPQNTLARKFLFGQRRDCNIRMAALAALNMLRLELLRPDD